MRERPGLLALILHAHLPFVRHPEHEHFLEEQWLFEALTESYIPLLRMLQCLLNERIPVKITMSITPTLCAMLKDELLRRRYLEHLDRLIALAKKECHRNRADAAVLALSHFYRNLFLETRRVYCQEWNQDLFTPLRQLRENGVIEIIASAATHGLLPILQQTSGVANAQIALGCDNYREIFGVEPLGFWLPECAYAPGIDELLQKQNIRWFIVDAHGLEHAQPAAKRG